MKTLLIYATNSGSTLEVCNYITTEFTQKGQEITQKEAREVDPHELNAYDLIILGSPTWGDGEIHESFIEFIKKFENITLPDKRFAVFGLGDSTYEHFCAAADHLEEFVKKIQGKLIIESLKINNFYFNQQEELAKITEWSRKILALP